jgi:hypothetical protein
VWDSVGERPYENGVDRGVLYVDDIGYVWNGLISVSEEPSGGETRSFYIDGIKFLSLSSVEDYQAMIQAYSSPPEFAVCDGTRSLYSGLVVTQQRRKSFGFSYRTLIGDDTSSQRGYKIHLVYNALAEPSQRQNNTLNDSPEASTYSWAIDAVPPLNVSLGFKPTAHFIIDSTAMPTEVLTALEDILYGNESDDPRLPSQTEILALFESYAVVQVTDNGDGTFTVVGPDEVIQMIDSTTFQITWPSAVPINSTTYTLSSL